MTAQVTHTYCFDNKQDFQVQKYRSQAHFHQRDASGRSAHPVWLSAIMVIDARSHTMHERSSQPVSTIATSSYKAISVLCLSLLSRTKDFHQKTGNGT